jgi:hypothetical protein
VERVSILYVIIFTESKKCQVVHFETIIIE